MITGSLSFPFPFSGAANFSRAFVFVAKIHFGGSFASLLKVAKAASECRRALITKTRGLPAFFLLNLEKVHPRMAGL